MELNRLVLEDKHIELGAKMMPFAGFNMPVRYSSDKDEHLTVRQNVGVFDVSHMGEFLIKGDKALDLVQSVTSNDASKLSPGQAQYSCIPNENGGIVDDLLVYCLGDKEYMLVVNASNIEKDWNWISSKNSFGAFMENVSQQYSLLAVQGPNAMSVIKKITDVDVESMGYYTFKKGNIGDISNDVIISATGYTGAGGFELYFKNKYATAIWDKLFEAGAEFGIKPIGLAARDTLRLEKGYCLYGNDIDDTTSPIEAGLGWIVKFTKEFTNWDDLKKQKEKGVSKKLVGFEMAEMGIPRSNYDITDPSGKIIGKVTSGTMSPSMGVGIGMGYVPVEFSKLDTDICIFIRGKLIKAKVVKQPIFKG